MFLNKSDKLAIVEPNGNKINYTQMVGYVKYMSNNVFKDVKESKHILIISENRKEWVFSFFAIWDRKAIPVALDAMSNDKEIMYFINDCNPDAVVVSNSTKDMVNKALNNLNLSDIKVYNLDDYTLSIVEDERILNTPEMDDVAVMIYTSGTTGNAKGIMLTYANIIGEIKALNAIDVVEPSDQMLSILPYHHILPLMATCLYEYYYENMNSVVIVDKLNSQEILKALADNNVTIFVAVPRVYKLFYKTIKDKINSSMIARFMFFIAKKVNNKKFSKIVFKKSS